MGDYFRLKENKEIVLKNTLEEKKLKTAFYMQENLILFSLKPMNTSFKVLGFF